MPAPVQTTPKCDMPGCGRASVRSSDGTETDEAVTRVPVPGSDGESRAQKLGRKAVPYLNTCDRHGSFVFSDDARYMVTSESFMPIYQERVALNATAPTTVARKGA